MLWHDDVPVDAHREALAALLQRNQERILHIHPREKRMPMVAAESEKVGLPGIVKALQSRGQNDPPA
jgi:hypothetical protein